MLAVPVVRPVVRTRLLLSVSVTVTLLVVAWVKFSSGGSAKLDAMQHEQARLESEVAAAKAENDKLKHESTLLSGDAPGSEAHLEKVAREELGYVGKDEKLLLVDAP